VETGTFMVRTQGGQIMQPAQPHDFGGELVLSLKAGRVRYHVR
jgi:hypothetical protein